MMKIGKEKRRYIGFLSSVGSVRVIGMMINAVTFPFVVRMLGVTAYGKWSYALVVVGCFELLVNPGIFTYAQREVAAQREQAADLIIDVFSMRLILSIAIGLILVLFAFFFEPDYTVRKLILLYGIPTLSIGAFTSNYLLVAIERFHATSFQQLMTQGIYAAGIFAIIRDPKDIYWLAVLTVGSNVIGNIFGWWKLSSAGFRFGFRINPSVWKDIISISLFYGVSSMLSQVYTRSGHIIVRWWLGEHMLGLYAAITRLAETVFNFVGIISGLIMPRIALYSNDAEKLRNLMRHSISALAMVCIPLAFGGVATSNVLIPLILGKEYAGSIVLFQIVSFYFIANSISTFYSGTVLYGLGKHRQYLLSTIAGAVFGLVSNFALVPVFGVKGACLSFVLCQLVVGLTAYWYVRGEVDNVWKNKLAGVALLSSLIMSAGIKFLSLWDANPIMLFITGVSIYLLSVFSFGRQAIENETKLNI